MPRMPGQFVTALNGRAKLLLCRARFFGGNCWEFIPSWFAVRRARLGGSLALPVTKCPLSQIGQRWSNTQGWSFFTAKVRLALSESQATGDSCATAASFATTSRPV